MTPRQLVIERLELLKSKLKNGKNYDVEGWLINIDILADEWIGLLSKSDDVGGVNARFLHKANVLWKMVKNDK